MRMRWMGMGLLALAGLAHAQLPAADGTIHACVHKKKRTVRVVDEGTPCKKPEQALTWNQTGPSGPTGATGVTGATGDPGPFPDTLTSGKTVTGGYAVYGGKIGGNGDDWSGTSISWPYPLAVAPTIRLIALGDPVPAGCTGGSADSPRADPGYVCIYEGFASGTTGLGNCSLSMAVCDPDTGPSARWGTVVRAFGSGSRWYSVGTWAVTAP